MEPEQIRDNARRSWVGNFNSENDPLDTHNFHHSKRPRGESANWGNSGQGVGASDNKIHFHLQLHILPASYMKLEHCIVLKVVAWETAGEMRTASQRFCEDGPNIRILRRLKLLKSQTYVLAYLESMKVLLKVRSTRDQSWWRRKPFCDGALISLARDNRGRGRCGCCQLLRVKEKLIDAVVWASHPG